jgi:hypothetical protein
MRWALFQARGVWRVVEATYLGRLLMRSMNPSSPGPSSAEVRGAQTAAKLS